MANVKRMDKIREASGDELHAQQKELSEQIFRLRFQLTTGQAEALKRLREGSGSCQNTDSRAGIERRAARRKNFCPLARGYQLRRSGRGKEIIVRKIAVAQ